MIVLGIDVSTKTGWVALDGDAGICGYGTGKAPRTKGMNRLEVFDEMVTCLVKDYRPDLVLIEGYGFANKFTLVPLVEIGTIFRYRLHQLKVPTGEVAPSSLKKFVTGKGTAKKDEMMRDVYKRWGFEGSDDECDAYALARFGITVLGAQGAPTKVAAEIASQWVGKNTQLVSRVLA